MAWNLLFPFQKLGVGSKWIKFVNADSRISIPVIVMRFNADLLDAVSARGKDERKDTRRIRYETVNDLNRFLVKALEDRIFVRRSQCVFMSRTESSQSQMEGAKLLTALSCVIMEIKRLFACRVAK